MEKLEFRPWGDYEKPDSEYRFVFASHDNFRKRQWDIQQPIIDNQDKGILINYLLDNKDLADYLKKLCVLMLDAFNECEQNGYFSNLQQDIERVINICKSAGYEIDHHTAEIVRLKICHRINHETHQYFDDPRNNISLSDAEILNIIRNMNMEQ